MIRIILTFVSLKVEGTLNCRINPVNDMPDDPTLVLQCIASFQLFSMSPVPAKHAMHSQQALHGYAMLRQAHPALNFDSKSTLLAMWPKDSKAYDRNMRHRSYSTSIYSTSTILNI